MAGVRCGDMPRFFLCTVLNVGIRILHVGQVPILHVYYMYILHKHPRLMLAGYADQCLAIVSPELGYMNRVLLDTCNQVPSHVQDIV
jgi:hypothetical protein